LLAAALAFSNEAEWCGQGTCGTQLLLTSLSTLPGLWHPCTEGGLSGSWRHSGLSWRARISAPTSCAAGPGLKVLLGTRAIRKCRALDPLMETGPRPWQRPAAR